MTMVTLRRSGCFFVPRSSTEGIRAFMAASFSHMGRISWMLRHPCLNRLSGKACSSTPGRMERVWIIVSPAIRFNKDIPIIHNSFGGNKPRNRGKSLNIPFFHGAIRTPITRQSIVGEDSILPRGTTADCETPWANPYRVRRGTIQPNTQAKNVAGG